MTWATSCCLPKWFLWVFWHLYPTSNHGRNLYSLYIFFASITIPATLKIILSRPNNSRRYYLFHCYKWKHTQNNSNWGSKRLSNLLSSHTKYLTDLFRTVWLKKDLAPSTIPNYLHSLLVSSIKDLCTTPKSHLPFDSSYLYLLLYSIRNWLHTALLLLNG